MTIAVAVDRLALHQLHDQEGKAVLGHATVEDACDVRMFDSGEDLALACKALVGRATHRSRAQHLDRNSLLEGTVDALGLVHRAHAAFTELVQNPIGADMGALPEAAELSARRVPAASAQQRRRRWGLGQQRVVVLAQGEQLFDLRAQLGRATGFVQKAGSLPGIQVQGAHEEGVDLATVVLVLSSGQTVSTSRSASP